MTISRTRVIPCPVCRREARIAATSSVNADRRPDLREAILDGSLQRQVCPDCGTVFHRPPDLCYVDHSRGQWIAAFPWEKLARWRQSEKHGLILFEKTCGAEDRRKLSARITFGWEALREKLRLAELGLDDVTLELCKLDLARTLPDGRLAEGTELRLLQVEGDALVIATIDGDSEKIVEQQQVLRTRYDELAGKDEFWDDLRRQVSAGMFVDLWRLTTRPD